MTRRRYERAGHELWGRISDAARGVSRYLVSRCAKTSSAGRGGRALTPFLDAPAKLLQLKLAAPLLILEQPQGRTHDLARIADAATPDLLLDETLEALTGLRRRALPVTGAQRAPAAAAVSP